MFSVNPASVGRSLWIHSCSVQNCARRATVRLGIDTLIANILVSDGTSRTCRYGVLVWDTGTFCHVAGTVVEMCKSFNLKKTLDDSSAVAKIAGRFEPNTV